MESWRLELFCCFFLRFDKAEGCKERNMNEKQEKKITIMKERRRREDEERRGRAKKKKKRERKKAKENTRGEEAVNIVRRAWAFTAVEEYYIDRMK